MRRGGEMLSDDEAVFNKRYVWSTIDAVATHERELPRKSP